MCSVGSSSEGSDGHGLPSWEDEWILSGCSTSWDEPAAVLHWGLEPQRGVGIAFVAHAAVGGLPAEPRHNIN